MKSALEYDGDDVKKDKDPVVENVNFENGDNAPLRFRLKVEVSSARDIDEVRIYLDGEKVAEDKGFPYGYNFELDSSYIGEHEFKVVAEDEKGNKGDTKIRLNVGS